MGEVVVVAEIGIAEGKREEALAALRTLCEETHANDDGCLLYSLQLDPADESRVFMIEKWESAELLEKHGASDHIKALGASGTLAGAPKVTVLRQANFGDDAKGTLELDAPAGGTPRRRARRRFAVRRVARRRRGDRPAGAAGAEDPQRLMGDRRQGRLPERGAGAGQHPGHLQLVHPRRADPEPGFPCGPQRRQRRDPYLRDPLPAR
jgi:quinol monooxygenase YgiN